MTVFNTAPYLGEAIDSILAQEDALVPHTSTRAPAPEWELLIVDDGSTDGSLEIARSFASRFPERILVLQHEGDANRGISASRNLALSEANAPLLTFLDSDDVWLPHHLQTLTGAFKQHPEAAMVFGSAERWVDFDRPFNEQSARHATWGSNYLPPMVPAGAQVGLLAAGELLTWFLQDESLVPCICSVMVRAEAAREAGGFCNAFRGLYDDQAFHAKMSLRFPILAIDTCVARYRQHAHSCCAVANREPEMRAREQQRFHSFLNVEQDPGVPGELTCLPFSMRCGRSEEHNS